MLSGDEQVRVLPRLSAQAKAPRSRLTVASTLPPSRTRTQCWLPTSAYQTAPSASMQIPSGWSPGVSAHTRRLPRLPSAPMSYAVSWLAYDSATISVPRSGVVAIPFGNARSSATWTPRPEVRGRQAPAGTLTLIGGLLSI